MRICHFGTYESNYPLNKIVKKGLKKNGVNVLECHVPLWEEYRNKHGLLSVMSILKLCFLLVVSYAKLSLKFLKECKSADAVLVSYIGQLDMLCLKALLLVRKRPRIIFMPLVSLYDTAIVDRGLSGKNNPLSKILFCIDKWSMEAADAVILDTNEHINYISSLFGIKKEKFRRIWVGADEEIFFPKAAAEKESKFTVLFFGKYIPLHGLEYIIGAANLLKAERDIRFKMIGSGQLYDKIVGMARKFGVENIEFVEWVEQEKLVDEVAKADAVLGIFGGTEKSLRVIPNKVYQAIACKKPVITGDSAAIRELFVDRKSIYLCENKDSESLKKAILELKNNKILANRISENGYQLFEKEFNSENIGKALHDFIEILIKNN